MYRSELELKLRSGADCSFPDRHQCLAGLPHDRDADTGSYSTAFSIRLTSTWAENT